MAIVSQIPNEIEVPSYELIRDRIAEILLVEIANQKIVTSEPLTLEILNKTNIFQEKFRQLNQAEMYAIAISKASLDFDNAHQTSVRNTISFYLDFFGRDFSTNIEDGDKRVAVGLQRLIGIARGILSHPAWYKLGLPNPSPIGNTIVRTVRRMDEVNTRDAGDILMYRMLFEVVSHENTNFPLARVLESHTTCVTVEETDLGFQYIYTP